MKGNRVVIPTSMRPATLNRLHDITDMVHKSDECQRHGNKKPRPPERQISATLPMEILGMDLVDFRNMP